MLAGISIRGLATPGWVNPPTVRLVEVIAKLASPLTRIQKVEGWNNYSCAHLHVRAIHAHEAAKV